MKSLKQLIEENLKAGTALGHFNFPNFEVAQAIVDAAKAQNVSVVLGASEGERKYVGVKESVAWVKAVNKKLQSENSQTQIFLNADHTYSFELVKEAVEAGFDMVIYDNAKGNLEDNIREARKCKDFIDEWNRKNCLENWCWVRNIFGVGCGCKKVLFEAEIGYIGSGSELRSELPGGIQKTTAADAKNFVNAVGPDLLAPAVGNVHGMLKDVPEPNLDEKLCGEIYTAAKTPLVLHGASGNTKEDIQACIKNGVAMVHVSTEIRVAYKNALKEAVNNNDDLAAYKYLKPVRDAVQKTVEEKIKIFTFRD